MSRPNNHSRHWDGNLGFGDEESFASRLRKSANEYEVGFERGLYKDVSS